MMNYEIFKEVVKEKFMDYMPEKFKGMELVVEPVEKVKEAVYKSQFHRVIQWWFRFQDPSERQ